MNCSCNWPLMMHQSLYGEKKWKMSKLKCIVFVASICHLAPIYDMALASPVITLSTLPYDLRNIPWAPCVWHWSCETDTGDSQCKYCIWKSFSNQGQWPPWIMLKLTMPIQYTFSHIKLFIKLITILNCTQFFMVIMLISFCPHIFLKSGVNVQ